MKPLPNQFDGRADQRGYLFTVLERHGQWAIVEKHNPAHVSGMKLYEVVRIQQTPKREFPDGRVVEPHESMPGSEKWGTEGYSCPTLAEAQTKLSAQLAQDALSQAA